MEETEVLSPINLGALTLVQVRLQAALQYGTVQVTPLKYGYLVLNLGAEQGAPDLRQQFCRDNSLVLGL